MDSVNKWLTLAANLGVIAGIIFLAIEINQQNLSMEQSNRIATSTAEADIRDGSSEISQLILEDPQVAELLLKLTNNEELTAIERIRANAISLIMLQGWITTERYFDNGLIDEAVFSNSLSAIERIIIGLPGIRPFFAAQFEFRAESVNSPLILAKINEVLEEQRLNIEE
mgnify:CR=1 FL=1|jgi:hypothetical protein